jgi:hypothetical protein
MIKTVGYGMQAYIGRDMHYLLLIMVELFWRIGGSISIYMDLYLMNEN